MNRPSGIVRLCVAAVSLLSCFGCALSSAGNEGVEAPNIQHSAGLSNRLGSPPAAAPQPTSPQFEGTMSDTQATSADEDRDDEIETRTVPNLGSRSAELSIAGRSMPRLPNERVNFAVSPQSIPDFINTVFGEVLETGFLLGPGVEQRQEVVTYRPEPSILKTDLYSSVAEALKMYGLAVYYSDGHVQILEDAQLRQEAPQFIRSRARASVPQGLRPVVQFVEIYAIDLNEMVDILRSAFPDAGKLDIKPNRTSNSLTVSGLPADVDRALAIINQMDELRFADTTVATLRIRNWDVEELAETLQELLALEGFSVSSQAGLARAITLKPIEYTQQLVIFAQRESFLDYAVNTARRLDAAAATGQSSEARVYKVQHYEAADLVQILDRVSSVWSGAPVNSSISAPVNTASVGSSPDTDTSSPSAQSSGRFVVDEQGNRIIFEATDEEYADMLRFLRQIDTPAAEVLIEVTIAEVTLTDDLQYGMEFLFSQIGSTGYSIGAGTLGGLGLADGGLAGRYTSGDYVVDFAALASNNQVNVLSTPRIVTKSGASASIQVGTDVPIIVTQSAGNSQVGGTTDILQTVQYRETGVIVDVAPLVLSDNRIDLEISQEVSSAEANVNQAIASPVISNRTLTTELTLQDGQSAILGGLIENRYTRGTSGVPYLKDLPLVGGVFSTETLNNTQTVLLVMITPYILDSREDRARTLSAYSDVVNQAFENQVDESQTLQKPKRPFRVETTDAQSTNDEMRE